MNEETLKATVSAAVVVVANVLAVWGIQLDADVWVDGICAVVMLVATVWGIWHNHNFTQAAQAGQEVTDAIKVGGGDLPYEADEVHFDDEEEDE